ncbi:tyrosine-type recombinase/integrase [Streptosporangium canum]
MQEITYDVRVHKTQIYKGTKVTTYYVRWQVGSERLREPYRNAAQADAFRSELLTATRKGEAFSLTTGRPVSWAREDKAMTWFDFVCAYMDMKWPDLAGHSRRITATVLRDATLALITADRGRPDEDLLKRALTEWVLNTPRRRGGGPPEALHVAVRWLRENSGEVAALADSETARKLLAALSVKRDGSRAAASTVQRIRGVLVNTLEYAIVLKLLTRNTIRELPRRSAKAVKQIDKRTVVNPRQARKLLEAVATQGKPMNKGGEDRTGRRLVAFFGVMYYAALRPEEAVNLRKHNLALPAEGWGELILEKANPAPGAAWSNSGQRRDPGPLKHREEGETRVIPCPPELTRLLNDHLATQGAAADGRLFWAFQSESDLYESTYLRIWRGARKAVLTPEEFTSSLAKRPYDLRHAAVSTWLNAGVAPTQVAEWAGHSVAVLLYVYAKCIEGQEEVARRRITAALEEGKDVGP